MEKILVVAAHPDDEIYGMGGTIARFSKEGKEVNLLIVSDGSTAQYRDTDDVDLIIKNKKLETEAAAKIVGIKSIIYGNLPDMRLSSIEHIRINEVIEDAINKFKPDTVFTHFYGDVNMDHRCVFQSTVVASRPCFNQCVRELYCYYVPSSTEWQPKTVDTIFMPNYLVDISNYRNEKEKAILSYETELRAFPHPRSIKAQKILDENSGISVGMNACEQFMLMRKVDRDDTTF